MFKIGPRILNAAMFNHTESLSLSACVLGETFKDYIM